MARPTRNFSGVDWSRLTKRVARWAEISPAVETWVPLLVGVGLVLIILAVIRWG